jgi:alpha-1,6-mannosyltransferase
MTRPGPVRQDPPSASLMRDGATVPPTLDADERRQVTLIRRFGMVGVLLLAVGSLGAGASPVFNPVLGIEVLNLLPRIPTVALACSFTGMGMVVLAWLWLGRFVAPGRLRPVPPAQLYRTMATWALPLAVGPPVFSQDVYSYLAQCKVAALGLDPYRLGPAQALGVGDALVRSIPNIWRNTPSPYGPLFLSACRFVPGVAGNHVADGVLLERALELIGVALILWALPRLARRFGARPSTALWLGGLNPLVLWHLVAGTHNDALMIGLMMAGLSIGVRRLPRVGPGEAVPPFRWTEAVHLAVGAVVITLGAMVKIAALPAVGFLGVIVARRLGGRVRHLALVAVGLLAVSGGVVALVSVGSGLGVGWVHTLGVGNTVRSWQAPMTALGILAGDLGISMDLGNHTTTAIAVARVLGGVASMVIGARILWASFRWRLRPMAGLGLFLAVVVLLGASVQDWYYLWALIPLATERIGPRLRVAAVAASVVLALMATPTGIPFSGRVFVLPNAYLAAVVALAAIVFAVRRRIPLLPVLPFWPGPNPVRAPGLRHEHG